MTPKVHRIADEPQPIGQSGSPAGALATRTQQMTPAGRWALGLGLAFASSLAWAFAWFFVPLTGLSVFAIVPLAAVLSVVICALAMAAGFTLSSWRVTPALFGAAMVGGLLGNWVLSLWVPGLNLVGSIVSFLAFAAPQLIVFLLVGTALGRQLGLALGQPHALSVREARASLWIAVIGLALVGFFAGFVAGMAFAGFTSMDVSLGVYLMLYAASCLAVGWLLRSWWGFIAAPLAYLAVATAMVAFGGASMGPSKTFAGIMRAEYLLYLVLPAVVMSAIGTAIGMYGAGQRGQRLELLRQAFPAMQERQATGQSGPPAGTLAARVQQMSIGARWALGLGLAFAATLPFALFNVLTTGPDAAIIWLSVMSIVLCALAMAAGFTLSSWWATLALFGAALVGGAVAGLLGSLQGPGPSAFPASFPIILLLVAPQLIVFLLVGTALGRRSGLALGQPHGLSVGEAAVSLWIAAIGPTLVGAYLAGIIDVGLFGGTDVFRAVLAILFAATCLVASWLLRSWSGFIAAPVAYVANAVLVESILSVALAGTGFVNAGILREGFALYIMLPAVVMSAIGTAIGMYGAKQGGQRPQRPQPALPAT